MEKLFGTDGIRGISGKRPLTRGFVRKIGRAAASAVFPRKSNGSRTILIGRDSRDSGAFILDELVKGMGPSCAKIIDLGIIPTPAVAFLTKKEGADIGIVISASHNPPEFNGIKFFSSNGLKLKDAIESRIEKLVLKSDGLDLQSANCLKTAEKADFSGEYADFVKNTVDSSDFAGLKIVLDCANGAAYKIAPEVFRELGAQVFVMGDRPDGKNINVGCGSLNPGKMAGKTASFKAFCGISLDGDADRCVFSDEKGDVLDGDDLIAIAAPFLLSRGRLRNRKVALTYMSNYGLLKYLKYMGIEAVQVPVGDKNVLDAMEKQDIVLGGESSGHLIFREFSRAGDGILTAVQIISIVRKSGGILSRFGKKWKRFPQSVHSVRIEKKIPFKKISGFKEKISNCENKLKDKGRIFIRYSGTEPLLRILVEGESMPLIKRISKDLVEYYKKHAGGFYERR